MAVNSLRILVVEDDPDVALIVRRTLEGAGHVVAHEFSAEAGLAAVKASAFDVVLMDNSLPGAMGITALPEFIAASPAPVVMMTGHANEDVQTDALLLGAKALVAKPFEPAVIQAALEKAVGKA